MGGRSFIAALAALLCHDVVIAVCTLPAAVVPAALGRTHTGNTAKPRYSEIKQTDYFSRYIEVLVILKYALLTH